MRHGQKLGFMLEKSRKGVEKLLMWESCVENEDNMWELHGKNVEFSQIFPTFSLSCTRNGAPKANRQLINVRPVTRCVSCVSDPL